MVDFANSVTVRARTRERGREFATRNVFKYILISWLLLFYTAVYARKRTSGVVCMRAAQSWVECAFNFTKRCATECAMEAG